MKLMILSTNRADWGHLSLIVREMKKELGSNVIICAAAGHFDRQRGNTANELKASDYPPDITIGLPFTWNSGAGLSKFLISFQKRLRTLIKANDIDYIMVLGDRIELLPIINISLIEDIGIIHISGGETTKGAVDDRIRQMLSMNAELIFTSGQYFSDALAKMGIARNRIINAGDPALELISAIDIPPLNALNRHFGLALQKNRYILMTYHPETDTKLNIREQFDCIEEFLNTTSYNVLCTAPNADIGGNHILKAIKHACRKNSNIQFIPHLGSTFYLSAVKHAALIMGNSSSTIIEAPFMKKHTLLIGNRQKGRPLHISSVLCEHQFECINSTVDRLMKDKEKWKDGQLLYEHKNTARIIVDTVRERLPDLAL